MNHSQIISKWLIKHNGVNFVQTESGEVYHEETLTEWLPYWNNGTISYRKPKGTERIGKRTIEKKRVPYVNRYNVCPF